MFGIDKSEWHDKAYNNGSYSQLIESDKQSFDSNCHIFIKQLQQLARKDCKRNIPDIKLEICEDKTFRAYCNYKDMKITINRGVFIECCCLYYNLPKEFPIQEKEMLLTYSLFFIIAHEMGHLLNCHRKAKMEFPESLQTRYGRCLEKDADCFAISAMTHYAKLTGVKLNLKETPLYTLLAAVYGVFLLLQSEHDFERLSDKVHPYTGFRETYCLSSLRDLFPSNISQEIMLGYIGSMNKHFEKIHSIPTEKLEYYWEGICSYSNELRLIEDDWFDNVMEIVAKYSYLPVEGVDFPRRKY